jgi:trans-2,3-dihydro-3-hydroxyanthranilate isomerase
MMKFHILDVFAKRRYEGNQLAVFMAPEELPGDTMQRIAREINFSESAFILRADATKREVKARIFTPRRELAFAGHPVIGMAHVVGKLIGTGPGRTTLDLKVGKVELGYSSNPAAPYWVQTVEPQFGQRLSASEMAAILGLDESKIAETLPIEMVTTGAPHFIVPLTGREALAACDVVLSAYRNLVDKTDVACILAFSDEPHEEGQDFSVRVFAEVLGVPEDPATGSGNSCLAAYVMKHMQPGREKLQFRTGQGYEMGRPSELHLQAERHPAGYHIHLGGNVVEVATGDWERT